VHAFSALQVAASGRDGPHGVGVSSEGGDIKADILQSILPGGQNHPLAGGQLNGERCHQILADPSRSVAILEHLEADPLRRSMLVDQDQPILSLRCDVKLLDLAQDAQPWRAGKRHRPLIS